MPLRAGNSNQVARCRTRAHTTRQAAEMVDTASPRSPLKVHQHLVTASAPRRRNLALELRSHVEQDKRAKVVAWTHSKNGAEHELQSETCRLPVLFAANILALHTTSLGSGSAVQSGFPGGSSAVACALLCIKGYHRAASAREEPVSARVGHAPENIPKTNPTVALTADRPLPTGPILV